MKYFLLGVLGLLTCFANGQARLAEKVYKKANDAVVRIYSYSIGNKIQGQGSGVILKSKNWIITNAHVLGTGKILYAEHHGIFFELDSIIVQDEQSDILVIRIKKNQVTDELKKIPDIKIFDSDKIRIGQRIFTIGSPLDFENTISEGIVSGIRTSRRDSLYKIIQISAPISEGSSGGAVLDSKGRLLGITTSVMAGEAVQNINFAIPINKVFKVISQPNEMHNALISFDSCFAKANEEMVINHFVHALSYCKRAMEFKECGENDKLLLCYMIGQCFLNLNEPDSAITYLKRAIPSSSRKYCYYFLGKAWMMKKNYEKSKTAFLSSIACDTNFADAYNSLALLYIRQNQLDKAMVWLFKVTSMKLNNPETNYLTARALFMSGKYDEAIVLLSELIKRTPNYAEAIYFLANVYFEKGETEKSFMLQQRAFEIKPELRYNIPE